MKDYENIKVVGRGTFGNVYLSRRTLDNKEVVIKQIPLDSISSEDSKSTENEVQVLSMLEHPNVIQYYDSYTEKSAMMIVMEYASGGNLYDFIVARKHNFMQEDDIMFLFAQLAMGMQHVHSKNILHRDLKTHNILLDRTHRIIKIGDFGISKILSSKSKAHSVVGTPCYLSPELCQEKPYNTKSDIWAMGCVLYEMVALHRAFEAETLPALIMKIMRGIVTPLPSTYSVEMRNFVHLLLHMDQSQRPDINQVIGHPMIFPAMTRIHSDLGMIQCIARKLFVSSSIKENKFTSGSVRLSPSPGRKFQSKR